MKKRILIAAVIAASILGGALFGGVLRETPNAASAEIARAEQQVEDFQAGFELNASTAAFVQGLQSKLAVDEHDEHAWLLLGLAYQQRARETGDPAYYSRSQGAVERALSLDPKDAFAVSGLGSLALSRHRFAEALALGRRAHRLAPTVARNYGVIGDAEVELGRYEDAFRDFDTMNRLRPDLSSYARVSYGRELRGNTAGAIAAMRLAIDAATGALEPTAWTHVQLAKLYFNHGRYALALRETRLANRIFPGYAYGLDAQAQAEAAFGRTGAAIRLERQAIDAIPLPQYVAALGDLYRVTGQRARAQRQYELIGAIEKLLTANGVKTDLEIALFQVDHGISLRHALERARLAHAERPSIDGDDVLAWALARNGRCAEALPYSRSALRLGTRDALKFFHRGMIERCLGRRATARTWFARALALNPHFSLIWSPVARRYAS